MPEICLLPPSGECIHVEEARSHCRIDWHDEDVKLKALVATARQAAESKTRQQLLHARWQLVLDAFPACAIKLPHSPLVQVEKVEYLDLDDTWKIVPEADYVANPAMMPGIVAPKFGQMWPFPVPQPGSVKITYTAGYASPIRVGGALEDNQFRVVGPVAWEIGDQVQFYNSGGVLPAPLCADAVYSISSAAAGVYSLADERGKAVTFTNPGTGRTYIGVVPEAIRSWMLLRVGALYECREEAAIVERSTVASLPFVDGLLDPFMTGYC